MRTNLTSLERLEQQLQAITPDRAQGDAWEKALKGWINAGGHPELTKAWMWGEWPGKLKAGLKGDKGVDVVAETRDKQLVAIQVKFRRDPNDPVTAPEVQKLVGSYRKHFALFALASNAWSATRGVSEAVGDEDAMLILREQLLESSYDWAAKKSIKRTKFTPFPFQKVAAENVRKALAKGGRAQIVMACGTGKTVTMLLAAEALDAQRVLVLAPTLLLVKQLRDEWVSKRRPDREWASLAVCSDIGDGMDESEIAPAEFGAPPTTNPDEIAAFLKKPGRRVVFGTYASSDRIANAQKKAGVPSFDLAVADEAHRIAGVVAVKDKSERSNRVMLEEKEIKAVRRLFATATPRITGSKKTRDGDEILIESMDDESRFGKVAHSVTFQEAVKLKRLVPYKLVVTIVTNDEVADAVQNRRFIDVKGKPYAAGEVATAIAIRRAYKELGISKIISYHSRVAGAKSFADLITQVPGRGKSPVTEHVAGSMPVNDRKQVLNRLAAATEPYLVTNARCLTEGIDVPALDAVAFADPRKSQVDIVQAVGRAMRRPMGTSKKTTGYIILPVYLTNADLEDPETAVEGSAFEPVLQVLRALKDHDPFMAKFMAKILVAKGKKPHRKEGGIGEILEVSIGDELDKVLAKQLLEAVQLRAIEVSADSFEITLYAIEQWQQTHGPEMPGVYEVQEGVPIGQRITKYLGEFKLGRLSPTEIEALERIPGWGWSRVDLRTEKRVRQVIAHLRAKGTHDGFNAELSGWIRSTRSHYKRGTLSNSLITRLESIPGWSWDPFDDDWEENYELLVRWKRLHGHCKPKTNEEFHGNNLGSWVHVQSQNYKRGTLSKPRAERLDSLGLEWRLGRHEYLWELAFNATMRFAKESGGMSIPQGTKVGGVDLTAWVSHQRERIKNRTIPQHQYSRIKMIPGWQDDPLKEQYSIGLAAVRDFATRFGHARVPRGFMVDGFNLGTWVAIRRQQFSQGRLAPERIRELEKVPGWVWNAKDADWEDLLVRLKSYRVQFGSFAAPRDYVDAEGNRLGLTIQNLRRRLPTDKNRLRQLKEIGFK